AVAVVGEGLDDDRDALRPVALVGDGLVGVGALAAARRPGDRALDVVLRHGVRPRLRDRRRQGGVRLGIRPALLGRDDDRARELREQLAATLVLGALLVLDRRPLGVTAHAAASSLPPTISAKRPCSRRSVVSSGWKAVTRTLPWRAATGRPSCSATTSTPSPIRSICGARMNTPGIGRSSPTSRSGDSKLAGWRPYA